MPPVRIAVLGGLRVTAGDVPVEWLASQRMRAAFLVFLAVEREASRDRLTGMFWPEVAPDRARRSLNQIIYTVRRSLGEGIVLTDGDRVRIAPEVEVDASEFLAAAEGGDAAGALQLYQGPFLADVVLGGSADLEQWVDAKRVLLERAHRRVARRAIDALVAAGDVRGALRAAHDWCRLDPDEDEAHHRYLELLIRDGQRREALRHFDAYQEQLRAADLEPLEETVALIAPLRGRQPDRPVTTPVGAPSPSQPSLPDPPLGGFQLIVAELKRRRLPGTIAVYCVIAWGAIQVSSEVFPRLGLPDWGPTLVILLALLGLPFTVFFAWVYDVTPEGIRRTLPRATSQPRRRPPLPNRWSVAAVLACALLFGFWKIRPGSADLSGTVAVFPFCTTGAELSGAGAGVAQLLAREVDAIPTLDSADPNVVIPAAGKLNCRDPEAAADVAARLGASRYLLGAVTRAGNEVRADATLYGAHGKMVWAVNASAASWLDVVDSLWRAMVEKQGATTGNRLQSVAATTTNNRPALLAFLAGEEAMRAVDWKRATLAYRTAVQLDSTFALAWFRLAFSIWDMGGPFLERIDALEHAKRFAAPLSEREQRLIFAFEPFVRGHPAEAIQRLRSYVGVYPDDAQGWSLLGDAELSLGPYLGHDLAAALEAHRNGARLGSADARFSLAWDLWQSGQRAASDSLTDVIFAEAPPGEWVLGLKAVRAFQSSDERRVQGMLDTIQTQTEQIRNAALEWAEWSGNAPLYERLVEQALAEPRTDSAWVDVALRAARLRLKQGRLSRVREVLNRAAQKDPDRALLFRAALALNPALPADPAEQRRIRAALTDLDRAHADQAGQPGPAGHQPARRLYFEARLAIALGDLAGASATADRLQAMPSSPEIPSEHATVAAAIRAQVAAARGDSASALAWLDRRVIEVPFWVGHHDFFREDGLRAEILARQGKLGEAARIYEKAEGDYGPFVAERLAQLYSQLGDRHRALSSYRSLRDQLAGCDPELRPLRQQSEQRLAALER